MAYIKEESRSKPVSEIGDIIVAINNRPVKEIAWEEQRKGLELQGETTYTVQKPDGQIVSYTLFIGKQII